jgi:hypothetical protein
MNEISTTSNKKEVSGGATTIARTRHMAPIIIGDEPIMAAVTDDGIRLLSERGVTKLFGSKRGGAHWRRARSDDGTENIPPFLSAMNLRPFVLEDDLLVKGLANRIKFMGAGGRGDGIDATLLPRMCDAILRARAQGKLLPKQTTIGIQAEIIVRGLAHIGIIALVDEATGYQTDRAKDALEQMLRRFVSAELSRWASTFSNDFYRELFRLRNITYDEFSNKRPQYIGHLTNDIVYARLAPNVLERLREVAPRNDKGGLKTRLYYNLKDPGYQKLVEHLASVTTVMKLSSTWKQFYHNLNRVAPRFDNTMTLMLEAPED